MFPVGQASFALAWHHWNEIYFLVMSTAGQERHLLVALVYDQFHFNNQKCASSLVGRKALPEYTNLLPLRRRQTKGSKNKLTNTLKHQGQPKMQGNRMRNQNRHHWRGKRARLQLSTIEASDLSTGIKEITILFKNK